MATVVEQAVALMLGTPLVCLGGYHLIFNAGTRERVVHWAWSVLLWPQLHERAVQYRPRHAAWISRPRQVRVAVVRNRIARERVDVFATLA